MAIRIRKSLLSAVVTLCVMFHAANANAPPKGFKTEMTFASNTMTDTHIDLADREHNLGRNMVVKEIAVEPLKKDQAVLEKNGFEVFQRTKEGVDALTYLRNVFQTKFECKFIGEDDRLAPLFSGGTIEGSKLMPLIFFRLISEDLLQCKEDFNEIRDRILQADLHSGQVLAKELETHLQAKYTEKIGVSCAVGNPRSTAKTSFGNSAHFPVAHSDFHSMDYYLEGLGQTVAMHEKLGYEGDINGKIKMLKEVKLGLLNVWHPLDNVVKGWPLAFVDSATLKKDDIAPIFTTPKEGPSLPINLSRHSNAHKWLYEPEMKFGQTYLFYTAPQNKMEATVHGAVKLLPKGQDDPIRNSIEYRCLIHTLPGEESVEVPQKSAGSQTCAGVVFGLWLAVSCVMYCL